MVLGSSPITTAARRSGENTGPSEWRRDVRARVGRGGDHDAPAGLLDLFSCSSVTKMIFDKHTVTELKGAIEKNLGHAAEAYRTYRGVFLVSTGCKLKTCTKR